MCTATVRLQSESDAVFMEMDETWSLRDKTMDKVTEGTNLRKWGIELEAKLRQTIKHLAAAEVRGIAVEKELSTFKVKLAASRVK